MDTYPVGVVSGVVDSKDNASEVGLHVNPRDRCSLKLLHSSRTSKTTVLTVGKGGNREVTYTKTT